MESVQGRGVAPDSSKAIVVCASTGKSSNGTFGYVRGPNEVDTNSEGCDSGPACLLPINNPKENPTSVLTNDDLKDFEALYGLPIDSIFLPRPQERADNEAFDRFCLYEKLFQLGLRLPLSPFIQEVLEMYGCASGQLMPNGWWILLGLQVLGEKNNIPVSAATVRFGYYPKKSFGRTQLHAHEGVHLVLNNPPREEGKTKWKKRFFFASKDLVLGTTRSRRVTTKWKSFNKVDRVEVESGAAMILKLSNEERNIEKLLEPDVLAGTSLWSAFVRDYGGSGDVCGKKFRREQQASAGVKVSKIRADRFILNPSKKRKIDSPSTVMTITPGRVEHESSRDESLDVVPQPALEDHAIERGSESVSKSLMIGKDMALKLNSCCGGVELYLTEEQAKDRLHGTLDDVFSTQINNIIYTTQLVASREEEIKVLQSNVSLLRNEKRKLEMEADGFKKMHDETVTYKDGLLEAHVRCRDEFTKEIEVLKKTKVDLELALEKEKEDKLIQVEMAKDVAAMESRRDFMIKIINKDWEISQATDELEQANSWLDNVSSADYEIGADGIARNKNVIYDDDTSSASSE